jgi:hypothetical protein
VEERREGKTLMIRGLIPVEARERAADVSTLTGISLTITIIASGRFVVA